MKSDIRWRSLKVILFITYLLSHLTLPFIFTTFYPWSHNTMFAGIYKYYSKVERKLGDKNIPPNDLDLGLYYGATLLESKKGLLPFYTINKFGNILKKQEVIELLHRQEYIEYLKTISPTPGQLSELKIKITTYGPQKNGSYGETHVEEFSVFSKTVN